jgi:nitroreductase
VEFFLKEEDMELLEALRTRRSARAFKNDPISRDVLETVFSDASNAPSAINMQPWEVHLVIGEELQRLSRRLLRSYKERQLTCGPGTSRNLPEKFIDRSRECALAMTPLAERMGTDFKSFVNEGSLCFYGAPAAAFLCIDESFPSERFIDIGSFLAYLVLAAAGHGLSSCPIGLVTSYADDIKDMLNIPESKMVTVSLALGYPDPESPINEFRSDRAGTREFLRWID